MKIRLSKNAIEFLDAIPEKGEIRIKEKINELHYSIHQKWIIPLKVTFIPYYYFNIL